jgi:hypothetical protein
LPYFLDHLLNCPPFIYSPIIVSISHSTFIVYLPNTLPTTIQTQACALISVRLKMGFLQYCYCRRYQIRPKFMGLFKLISFKY